MSYIYAMAEMVSTVLKNKASFIRGGLLIKQLNSNLHDCTCTVHDDEWQKLSLKVTTAWCYVTNNL